MRLLTLNTLKCLGEDVNEGFPLLLKVKRMTVRKSEPNPTLMKHILPSLDWNVILLCGKEMGLASLPQVLTQECLHEESFLIAMQQLLFDIDIESGILTCPESGRQFPIVNGMPRMLSLEKTSNV